MPLSFSLRTGNVLILTMHLKRYIPRVAGMLLLLIVAAPSSGQAPDVMTTQTSSSALTRLVGTWHANLDELVSHTMDASASAGWVYSGLLQMGTPGSTGTVTVAPDGTGSAYVTILGQPHSETGSVTVLSESPLRATLHISRSGGPDETVVVEFIQPDELLLHVIGSQVHLYRSTD